MTDAATNPTGVSVRSQWGVISGQLALLSRVTGSFGSESGTVERDCVLADRWAIGRKPATSAGAIERPAYR
jgi:hypothetical protein